MKRNELILLKILRKTKGDFGKVLTLGRQTMYTPIYDRNNENFLHKTLDTLLISEFGASIVDSLDYSDYEGANIIQNLSSELPQDLKDQYDLVIDFGTLEHIFNVETAVKNCSEIVKKDGWIIHANPSNNSNGHGLYQFSPEFYLSLYSEENGFANTRIFAVDMSKKGKWYEITPNKKGNRINLISRNETYIFCITQLKDRVENLKVFQSDYVSIWESLNSSERKTTNRNTMKLRFKRFILGFPVALSLREGHFRKHGIIHSVPDGSCIREIDVSKIE